MRHLLALLPTLPLLAAACTGTSATDGGSGSSSSGSGCLASAAVGTEIGSDDGGALRVKLLGLVPDPPVKGDNTWTVEAHGAGGAPFVDGTLVLRPFMPLHAHGTNPARFDGTLTDGGAWVFPPFDPFMPGRWEIRFSAEADGGVPGGSVVFHACIDG
ncbi:MAG: hypothetical protein HY904_22470 [Deltaproteobacteria bacterium]|nr:hypothetical protein [Deltaproteobacteria bacterium]